MKNKIPTLTAVAAALAAVTVAGCTPSPTPPPTFSTLAAPCTQAPGEPPCPSGAGVWRPSTAESAISAVKKFGAERLDATAARAALESGRPFLVGLPDGGVPTCHSALLLPGDPQVWILNRSSMPTEGAALERMQYAYGCGAGMEIPTPRVSVPAPPLPLDEAAKTEAAAAGKPFIYATCAGATVTLPDGGVWHLNRHGGATVTGETLTRDKNLVACGGDSAASGGAR
ncbi:hypothetical protein [Mycolicibacterium brisbanense]